MTTYKGIKGLGVQSVTTDAVASQGAGGTWASGNAANTARAFVSAAGTQTSGMLIGGLEPPQTGKTETYDGSSWSEVSDLNQVRHVHSSFGATSTTALAFGGDPAPGPNPALNNTEIWDGSSWSEVNELNTARITMGSCGITTAGITFAGGFGGVKSEVESWDGTSWTEITEMNTSREYVAGSGTQTAALAIAGYTTTHVDEVESWNGTAWSEQSDVNTARYDNGAAQNAPNSNTITFAGLSGSTRHAQTESWDGSSWTEVADLGTARDGGEGAGSQTAALMIAGSLPSFTGATEEWTMPATWRQFNVGDIYYNADPSSGVMKYVGYAAGTWASGGTSNSKRREQGCFGTQTAAVAAGAGPPNNANVEEYNGTAWTEVTNMPATIPSTQGAGTLTSGAVYSGSPNVDTTLEYDGTNWTAGGDLNTGRGAGGGCGASQTACLLFGGSNPNKAQTEEYNGTSWTEVGDLSKAQQLNSGCGTTTAALNAGGDPFPGAPFAGQSETFDGTSWTDQGAMPVNLYASLTFGTQSIGITVGGLPPGTDTNANMRHSMQWNGSAWSDNTESTVSRSSGNGVGTGTAGLAFGGYAPNNSPVDSQADVTEEWVMGAALKTLASTNA